MKRIAFWSAEAAPPLSNARRVRSVADPAASFKSGGAASALQTAALFLLLFPLVASAQVSHLEPPSGFVFSETLVRIIGLDLGPAVDCGPSCGPPAACPVRVFADGVEAVVHSVHPSQVRVSMPPQPDGTSKTFTLRAPGRPDRTFPFRWDAFAVATAENYVRYLVPVTLDNSLWTSPWKVHNASEYALVTPGGTLAHSDPPPPPLARPHETVRMFALPGLAAGGGAFVYVPRALDATTTMTLHAVERGRDRERLGTQVPIPRVDGFRPEVQLVGIPADARYRATLRIYSAGYAPVRVRVRTYLAEDFTGEVRLLEERTVQLSGIVPVAPIDMPFWPAYAQLDPLAAAVRAAGPRVRLEVASEGRVPLWAMVSITNDATQQVTIISPPE